MYWQGSPCKWLGCSRDSPGLERVWIHSQPLRVVLPRNQHTHLHRVARYTGLTAIPVASALSSMRWSNERMHSSPNASLRISAVAR